MASERPGTALEANFHNSTAAIPLLLHAETVRMDLLRLKQQLRILD